MPKRWLLMLFAAVVIAGGGGVAVLSASAAEIATPFAAPLTAAQDGRCLTVPAAAGPVTGQRCTTGAAGRQTLRFAPAGDLYTISPAGGTGCLSVPAGSQSVRLAATCTGGADQQFAATQINGTRYALKNKRSGRCVAGSRGVTPDSSPIVIATCHQRANQQWQLTATTPASQPTPTTSTPTAAPSAPAPSTSATPSPSPSPSASASAGPSPSPSASAPPSPAADDTCARPAAAAPVAKVTDVSVDTPVVGYGGEGDTDPLPMAIAARPSGGSWLAWLGTDSRVHLGTLDCDDHLVGTSTSFEGIDLQDVQADSTGGVLLLTRKGECHDGPLCGGSSSPCNTMHMVRFDNAGQLVWERQVTNLTAQRGGYDDGARFVWWYQHHGRLATDGTNYAAYFGVAITVKNGTCVDIHEGDRMQVVDAKGALVAGHRDSFEVGCSHAWTSRIVWDPRTSHFAMVCATDNACRIAQPNPYRTVAAGTCDGTLFGGDLVRATTAGYWTAWSQGGKARLDHFTTGQSDATVTTAANTSHPHLVGYGTSRMLLAWSSGTGMAAQVYDAGTGGAVGSQFTFAANDHDYQAFKAYPDGSAAYPAAGGTTRTIRIARVLPMTG